MPPHIVLVARCDKDLQDGAPDYSIWAGEQRIDRIFRKQSNPAESFCRVFVVTE
jgi:hypothetical protein